MGGALDINLDIHRPGEVNIAILQQAWQQRKAAALDLAVSARTKAAANKRGDTQDLYEIDHRATAGTTGKLDRRSRTYLSSVQGGGAWDAVKLHHAGQLESAVFEFCGDIKQTIDHTIWSCPAHSNDRHEIVKDLAQFDP